MSLLMYYTRKLCKKNGEMSGQKIFANQQTIKKEIQTKGG